MGYAVESMCVCFVCVHGGWIAEAQLWTGKDRPTAGAAVQAFVECCSQVFAPPQPLVFVLHEAPCVPRKFLQLKEGVLCSFQGAPAKDYKVSTWSRWAQMKTTDWQRFTYSTKAIGINMGGKRGGQLGKMRTVLFNRNKLLSTSRWHR